MGVQRGDDGRGGDAVTKAELASTVGTGTKWAMAQVAGVYGVHCLGGRWGMIQPCPADTLYFDSLDECVAAMERVLPLWQWGLMDYAPWAHSAAQAVQP